MFACLNFLPLSASFSCLLSCWITSLLFFFCSGDALTLPRVQCPNHPDAILVEDYRAGDMICPECGLVVGQYIHYEDVHFSVSEHILPFHFGFLCLFFHLSQA